MRLLSLTVRHYRLHRDLTIEFDPSRTLIGGPNESGKSTLAEAIHRVLFMRYKSGGELRKSMVSDTHGGTPGVSLTFAADGDTWTIEKEFTGPPRASARLSSANGPTFHGDTAEETLATLTRHTDGPANVLNQLVTRWAHLWVWQGTAGTDASGPASEHRHELIQRLQESGLAAVMQSDTDEHVRSRISGLHENIFTKTGSPKASSRLDLATKALAEATERHQAAKAQQVRLQAAVLDQESATRDIAASEAALPGLRNDLATTRTSLAQARDLTHRLETQQSHHAQATAALQKITEADRQILASLADAEAARNALAPAEAHLQSLTTQTDAAATTATEIRAAAATAATAVRTARQLHDLARACLTRFEKTATLEALTTKAKTVAELEASLDADRQALAQLPVISQAQLDSLRSLETQEAQALTALESIATGIELITSPQSVHLDNQPLAPGTPRIITETAELSLADGTRLRIQPGGGTSLDTARQKAAALRLKIDSLLSQLAIPDSKEAAGIVARRQVLENNIKGTQARLNDLGSRDLPEAVAIANAAVAAATLEVDQRLAALPDDTAPPLPATVDNASHWLAHCRESLETAEQTEHAQRNAAEAADQAHQNLLTTLQQARNDIDSQRQLIDKLATAASTLETIYGNATTRAQAIAEARTADASALAAVTATRATLNDLNPTFLETEVKRLERAITIAQQQHLDAAARLAVARNTLATDGTTDPDADLLQARAREAEAREEHAREARHADAIDLLHKLFTESRQEITRSVTQPIADRITGYLECLFGRGVRIDVDWSDPSEKSTLRITRPGTPSFAFDTLSGGAKEQVAAAVRLATAEILAASHDGCLPVLFDDSFAYSDDTRIHALQSMLDLAATRGLQVIVLTCTPAAYIGFGAHEIRLAPTPIPQA